MIIDSDKNKVEDAINNIKTRIQQEIEPIGGIAWITKVKATSSDCTNGRAGCNYKGEKTSLDIT